MSAINAIGFLSAMLAVFAPLVVVPIIGQVILGIIGVVAAIQWMIGVRI